MTIENENTTEVDDMASDIGDMLGDTPDETTDGIVDDTIVDDATAGGGDEVDKGSASPNADEVILPPEGGEVAEPVVAAGTDGGEADPETLVVVDSIDDLRKRIAEMSTPAAPAVALEDEVDPLDIFKEDIAYITPESLEQIAADPLLLNAAMNSVRRQTAEGILTIVPQLISKAIADNATRAETHSTFYTANPTLVPYKAYVSAVAKEVQVKMQGKTQEEILAVVAQSVKANLKLTDPVPPAQGKKGGVKPALRKGKGGGRVNKEKVDATSMSAQIDELLM